MTTYSQYKRRMKNFGMRPMGKTQFKKYSELEEERDIKRKKILEGGLI